MAQRSHVSSASKINILFPHYVPSNNVKGTIVHKTKNQLANI